MSPHATLAASLEQAEAAVQRVKDPALRKLAFEKVLERLVLAESVATSKAPVATKRVSPLRGPTACINELVDEGFFNQQRGLADVREMLGARGHHIAMTSLSGPMQTLCKQRVLRRQRGEDSRGSDKKIYLYAKW